MKYICEDCKSILVLKEEDIASNCKEKDCYGYVYSADELISNIATSVEEIPFDDHYQAIDKADYIKEMCKLLEILVGGE